MRRYLLGATILAAIGANPAHAMLQISVDVDGFTAAAARPPACDCTGAYP